VLRQPVSLSVLPSGLPAASWNVAGWLSVPPGASDILLILVHGAFYTHAYWDFPYRPETYSCVAWAHARGLATLNIDRLGAGESSIPPGALLDTSVNAEALHQIIDQAKGEGIAGRRFSRCVLVGHSLGSLASGLMQAAHGGADALVLTGVLGVNATRVADTPEAHAGFLKAFPEVGRSPAYADVAARYDADYVTMPSRHRSSLFYHAPAADPDLVAMDGLAKGVMAKAENRTMGLAADAGVRVTAPTLVQMGRFDRMYYNPERTPDVSSAYAKAIAMAPDTFTFAELVPDCGHNLALHPSARETYEAMGDWLAETLEGVRSARISRRGRSSPGRLDRRSASRPWGAGERCAGS